MKNNEESLRQNPLISIVTVCYNAGATIKNTLESVLQQTFNDYEYIIVDGASKDNTIEIVKNYETKFREKNIEMKIISEKDHGIYDAMNKGTRLCKGEWILILNADDSMADADVLSDVFNDNTFNEYDIVYGNCYRIKNNKKKLDSVDRNIDELKIWKFFCHQSCFTRRCVFNEIEFDDKFKICADYDFFLRAYIEGYRFKYFNRVICNYSLDGKSNERYYDTILENYKVRIKNGIDKKSITVYIKAFIWNIKHIISREW